MAKNIKEIPFTEMTERTSQLTRSREDVAEKVRGIINDQYVREFPMKEDWNFMIARTSLIFTGEFITGTVSANTGDSTLTFSSDVTTTSAMTGRKIKINANDYPYDITGMSGTTGLTITPNINGVNNIAGQTYSIYQPFYPLAQDFNRFPKDGGLHIFKGGRKQVLPEQSYQVYTDDFTTSPNDNQDFCRVIGSDTAGNSILEVVPPPKTGLGSEYDYYKELRPMRQTTGGLVAVAANATTVFGDSNTEFAEVTTGDFFRINAFGTHGDSEWFKVLARNGTALTLNLAFGVTGATSAGYTVCSAPDIPPMLHSAIMYGAVTQILADQNDTMTVQYNSKAASVLSDGKRIYKTRLYSKQVHQISEDFNYRR